MANIEFNYYQLSLLSFLMESHPHLADDVEFIKQRSHIAAEVEEQALREGYNQASAEEISNKALFEGLHFSKLDTVRNMLYAVLHDSKLRPIIKTITLITLPECEDIFLSFQPKDEAGALLPFPDDFESNDAYEQLQPALYERLKTLTQQYDFQQISTPARQH